MRYEIDKKHKIVDFYITDESGREHHCGLSFNETIEMYKGIEKLVKSYKTKTKVKLVFHLFSGLVLVFACAIEPNFYARLFFAIVAILSWFFVWENFEKL